MPDTGDPDALSSVIACREAELTRATARFDRADAAAASNGNFMSALVFALAGALGALHPHLPPTSLVLIVLGGLVTLVSMVMAALSWNPTATRGALAERAARLNTGPFASQDVAVSCATLAETTSFDGYTDTASVRLQIVRELEAKIAAAYDLASWSERRTGKLGFWNTTGFLLLAAGAILALAQH